MQRDGMTTKFGRGNFIALAVILGMFLLWSCDGGSSTDTTDSPNNNNTALIGPSGGTFTDVSSNVTVQVPPGALSTATELTCTYYTNESEIPDNIRSSLFGALGVVSLGPDGLEFDSAVTVTVPVSVVLTPGEQFPLFVWNVANSSWEMTEFICTASADGQSYSTQVTHFSDYTADNGYGSDGFFGNLEPRNWLDVNVAFSSWVGRFCHDMSDRNEKQMGDCCMGVTGRKFKIDYQGAVNFSDTYEDGDLTNSERIEHYEVTRGVADSEFYLHLTIDLYWNCIHPAYVFVEADVPLINLSDESNPTAEITARGLCANYLMPGVEVEFSVAGPGSVSPTSATTGADGYARTTYTASDTGTATITGTLNSCQSWDHLAMDSDDATIKVYECNSWELIVDMTFDHDTEYLSFHDEIIMYIPLIFSDSGEITSSGGEGTHHSASLGTSGPDCSVSYAYSPDFVPGASGEVIGPNIYVTIAPVADWVLMYTVTCIVDEKPEDIPVPPYNYLLPSIMAQVFNEYPIALKQAEFANGSGEWGDDYPILYTYRITVHGE